MDFQIIRLQGGLRGKDLLKIMYVLARDTDIDASLLFSAGAKVRTIVVSVSTI